MLLKQRESAWSVHGLRTRYFPKSRIGHGLVSLAPWLNLVLLLFMFLMLDRRIVLQPGVVVELPEAPFTQGTHIGLVAVILSVNNPDGNGRQEIVFVDDERFLVGQPEQMEGLRRALASRRRQHPDAVLVLEADHAVPHGVVMRVVSMASEVGIRKVNVAARPRG
jgi:biopolymer transport protein ExbD